MLRDREKTLRFDMSTSEEKNEQIEITIVIIKALVCAFIFRAYSTIDVGCRPLLLSNDLFRRRPLAIESILHS